MDIEKVILVNIFWTTRYFVLFKSFTETGFSIKGTTEIKKVSCGSNIFDDTNRFSRQIRHKPQKNYYRFPVGERAPTTKEQVTSFSKYLITPKILGTSNFIFEIFDHTQQQKLLIQKFVKYYVLICQTFTENVMNTIWM